MSLENPKNVIVDANCLLNGLFLPGSVSSDALNTASMIGARIFITSIALGEARRRLKKISLKHQYDPDYLIAFFDNFVDGNQFGVLDAMEKSFYPMHDNHMFSAASETGWLVLTTDQPLLQKLEENKIIGLHPIDFLANFDPEQTPEELGKPVSDRAARILMHGVPFTSRSGTIFARFSAGGWCENRDYQSRTLFEAYSILKAFYDNRQASWNVHFYCSGTLSQSFKMRTDVIYSMIISWSNGTARLWLTGTNHASTIMLNKSASWLREVRMGCFNSFNQKEAYEGRIYRISWDDRAIGKGTRKAILEKDSMATLNPFDSDRLEERIVRVLRNNLAVTNVDLGLRANRFFS